MRNDLDCTFWIKTPPKVVLDDGMFHISFDVGKNAKFELVMSPNTFLRMRSYSAEVLAKWRLADLDKVEAIRRT